MKKQTKNFFNQDKLKVEKLLEMQIYTFNLEVNETYGFEYYEQLDKSIKEFFDELEDCKLTTTFKIVADFDILKSAGEDDLAAFLVAVVNIFSNYIVIPYTSNGNGRLGIPKTMDGIRIGSMTLIGMTNRLMRFPQFRIEVLDLKGESIYEVF